MEILHSSMYLCLVNLCRKSLWYCGKRRDEDIPHFAFLPLVKAEFLFPFILQLDFGFYVESNLRRLWNNFIHHFQKSLIS